MRSAVDAYVAFYETLTPQTLDRLEDLCAPEVRFRDPFNDAIGVPAVRAIFEKMFDDVAEPRFEVTDRAISGRTCYLRWVFTFATNRRQRIDGVSEVHFDETGRVVAHIDHWDAGAQIYERVPGLGLLIRIVKRRLSARV